MFFQDLASPPSRSSSSSAGKGISQNRISADNVINEASRILAHDSSIRRTTPENIPTPASPVSGFSSRLSSCIPSPILSRTVTPTEVNKDFGGREKVRFELSNRKRKKIKGGRIAQIKNEDGVSSVDVSIPPSLKSLPEKEKEQINMSNLYVERIFRNYRDKKPVSSRAVSMPGMSVTEFMSMCKTKSACSENFHYVRHFIIKVAFLLTLLPKNMFLITTDSRPVLLNTSKSQKPLCVSVFAKISRNRIKTKLCPKK